ncbi:metallophosphoesterase family protein [Candidatus Poribacteria bacterium]|nr:metallophosphoesterase family protein [Candidatus Poribacteria bacterium]
MSKLRSGIEALRNRGAETLIHLGDMADTLRLETVDECIGTLIRSDVAGVMGNHEYSLVMHHFKRYPSRFSEAAKTYVSALPQRLERFDMCFTHFSPFGGVNGLFASTDDYSYEATLLNSTWPILVNGHSHDPRIYRLSDGVVEDVRFSVGKSFVLEQGSRYVLTCGALEDSFCALLDTDARVFEVISIDTLTFL